MNAGKQVKRTTSTDWRASVPFCKGYSRNLSKCPAGYLLVCGILYFSPHDRSVRKHLHNAVLVLARKWWIYKPRHTTAYRFCERYVHVRGSGSCSTSVEHYGSRGPLNGFRSLFCVTHTEHNLPHTFSLYSVMYSATQKNQKSQHYVYGPGRRVAHWHVKRIKSFQDKPAASEISSRREQVVSLV